MSKKHYREIADALIAAYQKTPNTRSLDSFIYELSQILKEENPRFDPAVFYTYISRGLNNGTKEKS